MTDLIYVLLTLAGFALLALLVGLVGRLVDEPGRPDEDGVR